MTSKTAERENIYIIIKKKKKNRRSIWCPWLTHIFGWITKFESSTENRKTTGEKKYPDFSSLTSAHPTTIVPSGNDSPHRRIINPTIWTMRNALSSCFSGFSIYHIDKYTFLKTICQQKSTQLISIAWSGHFDSERKKLLVSSWNDFSQIKAASWI